MYDEEKIIGFCAILHQPHPKNKKLKRCSRLVILPDYQGIGLGTKFLECIAKKYKTEGFDFSIITSAKNMILKLNSSQKWKMTRYNAIKRSTSGQIDKFRKLRTTVKTGTFFYYE